MAPAQGRVCDWDTNKVVAWMGICGFEEFSAAFEENRITGAVLVELDRDTLKDLGVKSVGRRLMLLKAIQGLQRSMTPDCDDETSRTSKSPSPVYNDYDAFVAGSPPSSSGYDYNGRKRAPSDRDLLIQRLAHEVDRLPAERLMGAEAALSAPALRMPSMSPTMRSPRKESIPTRLGSADGFSGSAPAGARSPRKGLRARLPSDANEYLPPAAPFAVGRPRFQSTPITPSRNDASELPPASPGGKQSFRIGREDKCAEVLPAVLRKYHIDDDWWTYALYISYGPGQRHERFVAHEEKVYPIMRSLKGDKPAVVLKKIDGGIHKTIKRLHH